MTIRVKARVLLELGSELISSDPIAMYELIKNSLDASATKITVTVTIAMGRTDFARARAELETLRESDLTELAAVISERLSPSYPAKLRDDFIAAVLAAAPADRAAALEHAHQQGSSIQINDNGSGMTRDDLESIYLTIGTPHRLLQKKQQKQDEVNVQVLGEKGIGRLSTMRLGSFLTVFTSCESEPFWNQLIVNWATLQADPNLDLENFPVDIGSGPPKDSDQTHGTHITIRDLQSDWQIEKLQQLAETDFAKLIDPFKSGIPRPDVRFFFNGKAVIVPAFDSRNLSYAHGKCTARFYYDENHRPMLEGVVEHKAYSRKKPFTLSGSHLLSALTQKPRTRRAAQVPIVADPLLASGIEALGCFDMEAHWFNRQKLQKEKPDGYDVVLRWLKSWAGGLMLFRDSFRVYPYAEPQDDWLDMDGTALGSSGYKLNRKQVVGAVRISSIDNPKLQDQTNREGLRDCDEKTALVKALHYIMFNELKVFLNAVEGELQEGAEKDFRKLDARVDVAQRAVLKRVNHLREFVPAEELPTLDQLQDHIRDLLMAWEAAKKTIADKEDEIENYLYLAGVGLMTEFIFHELTRITGATLDTLNRYKTKDGESETAQLSTLKSQLSTLEKRIRILDPMATPGRQRKENFDFVPLLLEILEAHEQQFKRHKIDIVFEPGGRGFEITAVKGQLIQIIENLISNSVYWLTQEAATRSFQPSITISIDRTARELQFVDNGPGIPAERSTDVFNAFFTTKPAGVGRGLGLYIAKKLAAYNSVEIELTDVGSDRCHHGFLLRFDTESK